MVEVFSHISGLKTVPAENDKLEKGSSNGLDWILIGRYINEGSPGEMSLTVILTWLFDVKNIKKNGYDGVRGRINANVSNKASNTAVPVDVNLTKDVHEIRVNFGVTAESKVLKLQYSFELTAYKNPPPELDPIFDKSAQTDCVLKVDEYLMHVNKSFLTTHSEYFRALFSANFAESLLAVIPIIDVSYTDFAALLKIVYPRPEFPTDSNSAKLLELAERFLMPGVTDHVEHHLLTNSRLSNDKILFLADKFRLENLILQCIRKINSHDEFDLIKLSPHYRYYAAETKALILDKIVLSINWSPFDYGRDVTTPGSNRHRAKRVRFQYGSSDEN